MAMRNEVARVDVMALSRLRGGRDRLGDLPNALSSVYHLLSFSAKISPQEKQTASFIFTIRLENIDSSPDSIRTHRWICTLNF